MNSPSDLFRDQTAWFSSSVDEKSKRLWRENGGTEVDFDAAMFIFSSNSTCADIERVFQSQAYISEHLAVFHSRFIDDSVHAGDRSKVVLGRYFLPPHDILEKVQKQMAMCWDVPLDGLQLSKSTHPNGRSANSSSSSQQMTRVSDTSAKRCKVTSPSRKTQQIGSESHDSGSKDAGTSTQCRTEGTAEKGMRRDRSNDSAGPSSRPDQTEIQAPTNNRQHQDNESESEDYHRRSERLSITGRNTETCQPLCSARHAEASSSAAGCVIQISKQKRQREPSCETPHSSAKQRNDGARGQQPSRQDTNKLASGVGDARDQSKVVIRIPTSISSKMRIDHQTTEVTDTANRSAEKKSGSSGTTIDISGSISRNAGRSSSQLSRGDSSHLCREVIEDARLRKKNPKDRVGKEGTKTGREQTEKNVVVAIAEIHHHAGHCSRAKLGEPVTFSPLSLTSETVVNIKLLPRVTATELTEFIPGKNGAQVFRKI